MFTLLYVGAKIQDAMWRSITEWSPMMASRYQSNREAIETLGWDLSKGGMNPPSFQQYRQNQNENAVPADDVTLERIEALAVEKYA